MVCIFPKEAVSYLLEAKAAHSWLRGESRACCSLRCPAPRRGVLHSRPLAPSQLSLGHQPEGQLAPREFYALQVFHQRCISVVWYSGGFTCFRSLPWSEGAKGFLTPMHDLAILSSLPAALLFSPLTSLSQSLARKRVRWLEQITFCSPGL